MKRFLSIALLSVCASAAMPAPAPGAASLADVPARVQAPNDSAVFRRLTLDNGLRVLLVSDQRFNKSAAALVVGTGQIDDPADSEGMAHFLEHMLFLGTDKYPDVSDYGNFIRSNGGYNNAYTTSDHTNYQFEVRHEAFAGALDRFAQFFIAPKFNAEFVGREVSAVHNEAMRHVQNDFRRMISVSRELYQPRSGEAKFSVGNKDTLARATPEAVRAFYESHYSAHRMALALAARASLDEQEALVRQMFAPVPRRAVSNLLHQPSFLPRKAALRLAQAEPAKEVRQLNLEFVIPPTRPDFLSKPDQLLTELISYAGPGGLVAQLKQEGLVHQLSAYVWERTPAYGSLMVQIGLTPAGQEQHQQVLQRFFSYLAHLRAAPFPAEFYQDRSRVAQLNETYKDRGEGAQLATKLANQALFYPLEIAERATDIWGRPDEAAYRRLLGALTPDNMLATLMAKGVAVTRRERIYDVGYSYTEDGGAAYAALAQPPRTAAFSLPAGNRFLPGNTALLAERPVQLIQEQGIALYYAQDTEYQRPQTTLVLRFVPVRSSASADNSALLRLYDLCLRDFLDPASGDAQAAGLEFNSDISLEGIKFTVTGFGDSPVRFANYVASQLRSFTVTPQRFEALKEVALRALRSYDQTEAYLLARDRRDALAREFQYLPSELLPRTASATWPEVQALARSFMAQGKLEAVVHGHLSPEAAVAVTRSVAAAIGARSVAESALLRRRNLEIRPGENILDSGEIAGVNSAFMRDYLLRDDTPATRAAAVVLANFMGEPFYTELRTRQQLGYIVGSGAGLSQRQRYFSFTVQSSEYPPAELRRRAEAFIATLPAALAASTDAQWATLVAGAQSTLAAKPKSMADKAEQFFASAFTFEGEWERRQTTLDALERLTREQAVALLSSALEPGSARQRTLLLASKKHPGGDEARPSFADRNAWKATRQYR